MAASKNEYDGAFISTIKSTPVYRVYMMTASNNVKGAHWYKPEVEIESGQYYLVWVMRGKYAGKKVKFDFGGEVQKFTDKLDKEE